MNGNLKTANHYFSEESDELPVLTLCLKEKTSASQLSYYPHDNNKRIIERCMNTQIGNDVIFFKQN